MKISSGLALFAALAIILYTSVGQVGGICVSIEDAKSESATKIKTESASTVTISAADRASGRAIFLGSKELRYNGSLYDIASINKTGDKWVLKVFHDEKEEGLLSNLKDIVEAWMNNPIHGGKHSGAKQIAGIQDYIPAAKFTFNCSFTMQALLPDTYSYPSDAPLLAVLKSPPKFA